ncbi:MAG: (2Fe-2S)-binding protein [Rhodocyclaceae bacterium]|nr:(2Fe-2S)-binding protein [Rhodocyclaceae bacterium]
MTDILFHCYCRGITQKRVLRVIAETGARTIDEIARASGACTGCRSCRAELSQLLEAIAQGRIALHAASRS